MEIIITGLICATVYFCINRLTSRAFHFIITHETKTEVTELPKEATEDVKTSLDGVLAEVYDAFGINIDKGDEA